MTSLGLATVFIVGDLIEERVSKSKHLQFISGVKPITYWISAYLWDYAVYCLTIPILVVMLVLMQEEYFTRYLFKAILAITDRDRQINLQMNEKHQ